MKINIEVEDKQLGVFLPHFRKKGLTWMVYNMRTRKGHDHLDFKELSDGLISPISFPNMKNHHLALASFYEICESDTNLKRN